MARLQTALDRFAELQALRRGLDARHGAMTATALNRIARRLVALVGASTNPSGPAVVDPVQLQSILAELETEIRRARVAALNLYETAWRDHMALTVRELPAVYTAFGSTTVGRLTAARDAFDVAARAGYAPGFDLWASRFQAAAETLKAGIRDALTNAQLGGWGQRTLAETLVRLPGFNFKNLPPLTERGRRLFSLSGTLSPDDALLRRAHTIARTEMAAVSDRMHRTWAKAAGMDRFVNVNSQPVAQECIEANAQEPMSDEKWQAWTASNGRGGRPPRHPNCDSGLMAVPPGF